MRRAGRDVITPAFHVRQSTPTRQLFSVFQLRERRTPGRQPTTTEPRRWIDARRRSVGGHLRCGSSPPHPSPPASCPGPWPSIPPARTPCMHAAVNAAPGLIHGGTVTHRAQALFPGEFSSRTELLFLRALFPNGASVVATFPSFLPSFLHIQACQSVILLRVCGIVRAPNRKKHHAAS